MSKDTFLKFQNVRKAFGDCVANHSVSFSVQKGTIHAIVGENGAGKSTIMKILFGLFQRDSGDISLNGASVDFHSPTQARAHGIGMVHQHFMLAEPMTALDHFFLEKDLGFIKNFLPLNRKKLLAELEDLSKKFRMPVPWMEKIENLSVGIQQRIEVLKLLYEHAEILILDEPTAVLTPHEVEAFFDQLRFLKKSGKTILLITHKLNEVLAIADEVTVFRKGETIQTLKVQEASENQLAQLMIGSEFKKIEKPVPKDLSLAKTILKIENLNLEKNKKKILDNISFEIKAGEILGVAGVEGNGQSELIKALIRPLDLKNYTGEIYFLDTKTLKKPTAVLRKMGMSCLPENRIKQALLPEKSAVENYLMGFQNRFDFQKNGVLQSDKILKEAEKAFESMDIRPRQPHLSVKNFSGGNQQKLVVMRELQSQPKLLIAAQPTRGVDIGSIQNIHGEILKLKAAGAAILLISSELSEILDLSDRILVLFEGQIKANLVNQNLSEEKLGTYMGGLA